MRAFINHSEGMERVKVAEDVDMADIARIDETFRRNNGYVMVDDFNGTTHMLDTYDSFEIGRMYGNTVVTFRFE